MFQVMERVNSAIKKQVHRLSKFVYNAFKIRSIWYEKCVNSDKYLSI